LALSPSPPEGVLKIPARDLLAELEARSRRPAAVERLGLSSVFFPAYGSIRTTSPDPTEVELIETCAAFFAKPSEPGLFSLSFSPGRSYFHR